jgi:sugar-phosphatase
VLVDSHAAVERYWQDLGTAPLATARMRAAGITAPPVVVTADQVAEGKPAPDTYLVAFARLRSVTVDQQTLRLSPPPT